MTKLLFLVGGFGAVAANLGAGSIPGVDTASVIEDNMGANGIPDGASGIPNEPEPNFDQVPVNVDPEGSNDLVPEGSGEPEPPVEDKCKSGNNNCNAKAECTFDADNADGYTCKCIEGYVGTGKECKLEDKCGTYQHTCHEKAKCENVEARPGYACTCVDGYVGDGEVCKLDDKCGRSEDNCNTNAACTNAENDAGYTCACNPGYAGGGVNCFEVPDEDPVQPDGSKIESKLNFDLECNVPYSPNLSDPTSDEYKAAEKFVRQSLESMEAFGSDFLILDIIISFALRAQRSGQTVAKTEVVFETTVPTWQIADQAISAINTAAAEGKGDGLIPVTLELSTEDVDLAPPTVVYCCSKFALKYPYSTKMDIPNNMVFDLIRNTGYQETIYVDSAWRYVISKHRNGIDWTMYKGTYMDLIDDVIEKAMFIYGDATIDRCINDIDDNKWYATNRGQWIKAKLDLVCLN